MQRDLVLLDEILQAAERIVELTVGRTADDVEADELRREAVLWNFTVLGEATSQLSDDFRASHPEIEWRRPIALRNRIVHGYWSADIEVLVVEFPRFPGHLPFAAEAAGRSPRCLDRTRRSSGVVLWSSPGSSTRTATASTRSRSSLGI